MPAEARNTSASVGAGSLTGDCLTHHPGLLGGNGRIVITVHCIRHRRAFPVVRPVGARRDRPTGHCHTPSASWKPVASADVTDFPDKGDTMTDSDDPLNQMMAGMAAGDPAFLFAFIEAFGTKVRWIVRSILEGMGRHDIVRNADELDGLTLDACDVIFSRAAGWKPDGAAPWNWAFKAIRAEVARVIGHRVVELNADDDRDSEVGSHSGVASDLAGDDLAVLIRRHPRVDMLDQAIRSVGSERDQCIYWEYRLQQGFGDPSPAHTVGSRFALNPDNVRQICRRHGQKVWKTIETDHRFAELRDHGWFAA
jgi:hypothetical protein